MRLRKREVAEEGKSLQGTTGHRVCPSGARATPWPGFLWSRKHKASFRRRTCQNAAQGERNKVYEHSIKINDKNKLNIFICRLMPNTDKASYELDLETATRCPFSSFPSRSRLALSLAAITFAISLKPVLRSYYKSPTRRDIWQQLQIICSALNKLQTKKKT